MQEAFLKTYAEHQALLKRLPGQSQLLRERMPDLQKLVSKTEAAKLADVTTLQQVRNTLSETSLNKAGVKAIINEVQDKSVGPIGRAFLSTGQTLHRVFSGETSMDMLGKHGKKAAATAEGTVTEGTAAKAVEGTGESAAKGGLTKLLGPALTGGLIIGQSLTEAHKAPKGDKIKSFFDNFMGVGMGSFLGWEVSRKFLFPTNILPKLFPFLLKNVKLLPFLPEFGLARAATELLSIFVLSIPFQKAGEAISHAIFGTPKKKEAEKLQKQQKKHGGQPGQAPQIPGGGAQVVPSLVDSRGVFSQFKRPGGAAQAGNNGTGISLSPSDISQSAAKSADDAAVQAMLKNPNWDQNSLFQLGGGS